MSKLRMRKQTGFTIVELLIVIVVIGILAAITIVAYNGIQNRANDTTVQSDVRNFAGKIMEYQAINGDYPVGRSTNGPGVPGSNMTFKVSIGSYTTSKHNFVYCTNAAHDQFVVAAESKSGKRFSYTSTSGLGAYDQDWGGVVDVCSNAGYSAGQSYSYGYNHSSETWWSWTQ